MYQVVLQFDLPLDQSKSPKDWDWSEMIFPFTKMPVEVVSCVQIGTIGSAAETSGASPSD